MKKINNILIVTLMILSQAIFAQTITEDFEREKSGNTSFISNGVIFDIISKDNIFEITDDLTPGWNGTEVDKMKISNFTSKSLNFYPNSSFSIKSTLNLFKAKKFWFAAAGPEDGPIPTATRPKFNSKTNMVSGTLTIKGKLGGVIVYEHTKSYAFNPYDTNEIYKEVNLEDFDGNNFSNITIDELELTLGGNFLAMLFDAFTWDKNENIINSNSAPEELNTKIIDQKNITCDFTHFGSATVGAWGGTAPYTYEWNNGQKTATAYDLFEGNSYSVIVSDAKGNTRTENVTITRNILGATISKVDMICGALGSASVTVTGGAAPFKYEWSNGATTSEITNLSEGTYYVRVTDANSCQVLDKEVTIRATKLAAPAARVDFRQGDDLRHIYTSGSNIKWYSSLNDAQNHINSIPDTTPLKHNTNYYATQKITGVESIRPLVILAFNETLAVKDLTKESKVTLYPNPTKDILNIESASKVNRIVISDFNGRVVLEKTLKGKNNVDVKSLAKGIYIIKIFTDKESKTMKFIKD